MTAHAIPQLKSRLKVYLKKLVDYSWDTSLVLTFGFGAIMIFMLSYGLAITYKIINTPPLLCHYIIGNKHFEDICK